jgi:hypothetical protein
MQCTFWTYTLEVAGVKFESPPYCAVNVWCPPASEPVDRVAEPLITGAVPIDEAPSKNSTLPVAVFGVIVAV